MRFISWLSEPRRRPVGRGPSHATRACERVSLAVPRMSQKPSVVSGLRTVFVLFEGSRGTGPRATAPKTPLLPP